MDCVFNEYNCRKSKEVEENILRKVNSDFQCQISNFNFFKAEEEQDKTKSAEGMNKSFGTNLTHGHRSLINHETTFLPVACPLGCFRGDFQKEGLPLEWIGSTEDDNLTAELQRLKKLWIGIMKKGRKSVGDECLSFRIMLVNEFSHVAHLDKKANQQTKNTKTSNGGRYSNVMAGKTPRRKVTIAETMNTEYN